MLGAGTESHGRIPHSWRGFASTDRANRLTAAQILQHIRTEISKRGLDPQSHVISEITSQLSNLIAGHGDLSALSMDRLGAVISQINWTELAQREEAHRRGEGGHGSLGGVLSAEARAQQIHANLVAYHSAAVAEERHRAAVAKVQDQSAKFTRLIHRNNDAALRRPDGTPILPPGYDNDQGRRVVVASDTTRDAEAAYKAALLTGDPAKIQQASMRLATARGNEFTVAADPAARVLGGLSTVPNPTAEQREIQAAAQGLIATATAEHRAVWDQAMAALKASGQRMDELRVRCLPERLASEYGHVEAIARGMVAGRDNLTDLPTQLRPSDYTMAYEALVRSHGADYVARHLALRARMEGSSVDQLLAAIPPAAIQEGRPPIDLRQSIAGDLRAFETEVASSPGLADRAINLIRSGFPVAPSTATREIAGTAPSITIGTVAPTAATVSAELIDPKQAAARTQVVAELAQRDPIQLKREVKAVAQNGTPTEAKPKEGAEGHGLKVVEKAPDKDKAAVARA